MSNSQLRSSGALVIALLVASSAALAQRIPKPGFNIFSKQQDIEIGKEGSAEIEKKVELINRKELSNYIQQIGRKLASAPEADEYPYTFKVVHDESINAFALPGGPTYVHTGLILAAENEAQLAGVMAHEIAHVALRHGTNQASKGSLLSLGAMLGGSLLGSGSIGSQLAQMGIGFGANSVLLKFSRGAERDADILGARIMAHAGYNPIEMARFFEKLEAETGNRGAVAQFFSSHPNPGNRTQRVEEELQYFPQRSYETDSRQLARMQSLVKGLPPPKKAAVEAAATPDPSSAPAPSSSPPPSTAPSVSTVPAPPVSRPSQRLLRYRGREFAFSYPDNWQVSQDRNSSSVTLVPEGGVVQYQGGGSAIGRGVIANYQQTGRGGSVDLERDTEALIAQLRSSNPNMQPSGRESRRLKIDSREALLTTLHSDSPYSGTSEVDLLLTVDSPGGLFYMVFIAPQNEFRDHQPTFEQIMYTVRFSR